jgi:hypothetical protein
MYMNKNLQIAAISFLVLASMIGCSGSTPQASSKQEQDFKGAPMPDSAKKQFEDSRKASADLIAKKAAEGASAPHTDPK